MWERSDNAESLAINVDVKEEEQRVFFENQKSNDVKEQD